MQTLPNFTERSTIAPELRGVLRRRDVSREELRHAASDDARGGASGVASCASSGANSNGNRPLRQTPDDAPAAASWVSSGVASGLNANVDNHLPQNPDAPPPGTDRAARKKVAGPRRGRSAFICARYRRRTAAHAAAG